MANKFKRIEIDTRQVVLSCKSLFYKTDNFIKQTRYVSDIDILLSVICQSILLNIKDIIALNETGLFSVATMDNRFCFVFSIGKYLKNDLNEWDIVFLGFETKDVLNNNQRIDEYVKLNSKIMIEVSGKSGNVQEISLSKLYLVSNISNVNLPRLNKEQKDIVEIVDKNVLVQGVAGSGKTNICIDKIIFTACKNFSGRTLYSTFSRGLLVDTKLKVEKYKKDLEFVLNAYKLGNIVFLDDDHKKALENRLGIYFFSNDDNDIFGKIRKVLDYLENKVDYLLIEDIYRKYCGDGEFVGQEYFINKYSSSLANYNIKNAFSKLSKYSKEIIYKEIFGMVLGYFNDKSLEMIPQGEYVSSRENSFSKEECLAIYQIAKDYLLHCQKNNLKDNNIAAKELLVLLDDDFKYSLSIIDEVQDYTQVGLNLFKKLSLKLFCVGDALQMINPSYFSFGYLKNLLYNRDITDVKELKYNYRNGAKIVRIIDSLGEVNKAEFGTHNFVLNSKVVDDGAQTRAIYFCGGGFAKEIARGKLDNFTFVVSSNKAKSELQKIIKNQEVLTISEIKGLERPTIIAYNILSDNADKWKHLEVKKVNHKQADENSVYRYYYNLFYVGVTRARQNIFVVEDKEVSQFVQFFKANFEKRDLAGAVKTLTKIVGSVEFSQNEILDRVNEFIKLGQYDNARFLANKISDENLRIDTFRTIEVNETLISRGQYREAGIRFWEYGLLEKAKEQFLISGDEILIDLLDKCSKKNSADLSIDIVDFFEDVKDNKIAQEFIIETIKKDVDALNLSFRKI
ncbi:MAG: UvrD-helicase domain-containing protein [Clostridia bacterium]|nr:UvrD-helicase domain-containing protein [Clostridia bacterium]